MSVKNCMEQKRTNRADGVASSGGSLERGDMLFIITLESAPAYLLFIMLYREQTNCSSVVIDLFVERLVSRVQKQFLKPAIQMAVKYQAATDSILLIVHENLFLCTISIIVSKE